MVLNDNYCNQSVIEIYYLTKEDLVNLGLWRLGMNICFIVSNLLLACVEMPPPLPAFQFFYWGEEEYAHRLFTVNNLFLLWHLGLQEENQSLGAKKYGMKTCSPDR